MSKRANSYSTFKESDLRHLGIKVISEQHFAQPISLIKPSELLLKILERNLKMPIITEKAKSELIVTPILTELVEQNNDTFTFYSGHNFDVDTQQGLKGFCDFLFTLQPKSFFVESPVFAVIEAKKDEIDMAVPQCVAQLYAAQLFNAANNHQFPFIYGAITTGYDWRLVKFSNMTAVVDTDLYTLRNLSELMGVLQLVVNYYKNTI